jgi:xanthine dehydrogenase molybdenum-binding subunit
MAALNVVGQRHTRIDAEEKVTGRTSYVADLRLPGMLMCKLLISTRSHARIVSIDISEALELPGVHSIITGNDFPDVYFGSGAVRDRRIMARDEVFYVGEPVAAVAADDEMTALEALDLIQVEYEDLPVVVDPLEAIGSSAPLVHENLSEFEGYSFSLGGNQGTLLEIDRGDVEQAFQDADHIFEETYRSQAINQGFLEPMVCAAEVEANGRITIYASTQGPYQVRHQLASVLDIPLSSVKVVAMEMGGGFGAKLRLAFEAFPALLAKKAGRPVKLVNTREESFTLNGPRLATTIFLKTGVTKEGRIVAREAYTIFDLGAYLGAGPNSGVSHAVGPYNVSNLKLRSYGIYTNKIYVGSYRASGVADMTFAVESHTDSVARQLGMDPLDFRILNAVQEGDSSANGATIPKNGLMETLLAVKQRMGLPKKLEEGRGIGIALCEWRSGSGPSTASISVNEDGTVSLLTGSVDISGSDTSLAQIAAEALGIPLSHVIVSKRDTDMAPFTQPTGGSRIVYSQGKAVELAAKDALSKLYDLASGRLGVPADALACSEGRVYVQDNPPQGLTLEQLGRMSLTSPGGPIIGIGSLSSMPYAPVYNTQAAEVQVDKETGHVKLIRFVQAQDVGVAINPMTVEGQLEGGAVQGIGRALSEEMIIDPKTGAVRNPSLASYLMPLAVDMPEIETILVSVPSEDGPFGARAVAESPGFGPPAAIANAVYDAIGVRIKDLPLSPERVKAALAGKEFPEAQIDVDALRRAEEGQSEAQ